MQSCIYLCISAIASVTAIGIYLCDILDLEGLVMTIGVIFATYGLFILGDCMKEHNGCASDIDAASQTDDAKQLLFQVIIVSGVFITAVVAVFAFSAWAVHVGITSDELRSDMNPADTDPNTSNTVIIANALIWSFTLLMATSYIFSRIGFQMSKCALALILCTVASNKNSQRELTRSRSFSTRKRENDTGFIY
jgi:multisubunit Na+/H+ antiporter MnhC subunit